MVSGHDNVPLTGVGLGVVVACMYVLVSGRA